MNGPFVLFPENGIAKILFFCFSPNLQRTFCLINALSRMKGAFLFWRCKEK